MSYLVFPLFIKFLGNNLLTQKLYIYIFLRIAKFLLMLKNIYSSERKTKYFILKFSLFLKHKMPQEYIYNNKTLRRNREMKKKLSHFM